MMSIGEHALAAGLPAGLAAITLGSPLEHPPTFSALTAAWPGVVIERFFRVGGDTAPVTPTSAYLGWDAAALYLLVRCADPLPVCWPGEAPGTDDTPLARRDTVSLWLSASFPEVAGFFRFALTAAGDVRGERFAHDATDESAPVALVTDVSGACVREAESWRGWLRIPWAVLGGRPSGAFGLQLVRERKQFGEILSPSALDAFGNPATDQFIEVHFGERAELHAPTGTLVTLPSGLQRWQRVACTGASKRPSGPCKGISRTPPPPRRRWLSACTWRNVGKTC